MKMPTAPVLYAVGGIVAAAVIGWFVSRAMDKIAQPGAAKAAGAAVGGAAVDLITGTVSGASDAAVAAGNNPSVNPLYPVGSWIGGTVYDWTHSKQNGGVW